MLQLSDWYQQGALVGAGFILAVLLYLALLRPVLLRRLEHKVQARKDQFVALASHYLLTPITIIQTATAQLKDNDATLTAEDRRKLYEAITVGQQRLWIIAEQLVLVNQVDHNELRLRMEVGDLSNTVSSAVTAVDVFARHKNINLRYQDLTQNLSQARFDSRRMRQALIALLDNAIKFSVEDTQILVQLSHNGGYFTITVTDQGLGMAPEVLERITQKFFRGSEIYNFNYEGLGLGLYLAYAIVRQHQGQMYFDSRPKKGTTVTIQFPNL